MDRWLIKRPPSIKIYLCNDSFEKLKDIEDETSDDFFTWQNAVVKHSANTSLAETVPIPSYLGHRICVLLEKHIPPTLFFLNRSKNKQNISRSTHSMTKHTWTDRHTHTDKHTYIHRQTETDYVRLVPHGFSLTETSNDIVLKLIQSLPLNKASGLDGISAKLLKEAGPIVSANLDLHY